MPNYKECPRCGGKYHPNTAVCPTDQTPLVWPGALAGEPTIGQETYVQQFPGGRSSPPPVPSYSPQPLAQPSAGTSSSGKILAVVLGLLGMVLITGIALIYNATRTPASGQSVVTPPSPVAEAEVIEVKALASELLVTASTTRPSYKSRSGSQIRTDASALLDGNFSTSWCEQEKDDATLGTNVNGTNAEVLFEVVSGTEEELARLGITPGYIKGNEGKTERDDADNWDRWPVNNRAKRIEVLSSTGQTVTLDLNPYLRSIQTNNMPTGFRGKWFKVRVLSVVKGSATDNDLCISEIELYFRRTVNR